MLTLNISHSDLPQNAATALHSPVKKFIGQSLQGTPIATGSHQQLPSREFPLVATPSAPNFPVENTLRGKNILTVSQFNRQQVPFDTERSIGQGWQLSVFCKLTLLTTLMNSIRINDEMLSKIHYYNYPMDSNHPFQLRKTMLHSVPITFH